MLRNELKHHLYEQYITCGYAYTVHIIILGCYILVLDSQDVHQTLHNGLDLTRYYFGRVEHVDRVVTQL